MTPFLFWFRQCPAWKTKVESVKSWEQKTKSSRKRTRKCLQMQVVLLRPRTNVIWIVRQKCSYETAGPKRMTISKVFQFSLSDFKKFFSQPMEKLISFFKGWIIISRKSAEIPFLNWSQRTLKFFKISITKNPLSLQKSSKMFQSFADAFLAIPCYARKYPKTRDPLLKSSPPKQKTKIFQLSKFMHNFENFNWRLQLFKSSEI